MSFYNDLANVYQIIFPVNHDAINFLSENINSDSNILDVACGIGGHCQLLADICHTVTGIDLNIEMIKRANESNTMPNVSYKAMNMLDLSEITWQEKFSQIFCIGNSLVHLSDSSEVLSFLKSSFDRLELGGELVIQIINYDRIILENIRSLPLIEDQQAKLTFERIYTPSKKSGYLDFITKLIVDKKQYDNVVQLLILRRKDLEDLLISAGFDEIEFFSDFKKNIWSISSYQTICRAKRISC